MPLTDLMGSMRLLSVRQTPQVSPLNNGNNSCCWLTCQPQYPGEKRLVWCHPSLSMLSCSTFSMQSAVFSAITLPKASAINTRTMSPSSFNRFGTLELAFNNLTDGKIGKLTLNEETESGFQEGFHLGEDGFCLSDGSLIGYSLPIAHLLIEFRKADIQIPELQFFFIHSIPEEPQRRHQYYGAVYAAVCRIRWKVRNWGTGVSAPASFSPFASFVQAWHL